MKCYACERRLSNDPTRPNFGLWTATQPRWAYCAPLKMCPGCGCGWKQDVARWRCPECGSRLREAIGSDADFTNDCAHVTLADHLAEVTS